MGFTKKNGKVYGVQLYKCANCGKQFLGGKRIDNKKLWDEYTKGQQIYLQLAQKYDSSIKTVQRRLDNVQIENEEIILKGLTSI